MTERSGTVSACRRPSPPAGLRTRAALLDAGAAVAEREGLAGLSVNRVVAEAGVAKGTFYVHFADRAAFVDALHERFYAQVREAVDAASAELEPGAERLQRAALAYLDACLSHRAVKALLVEARTDGSLTDRIASRGDAFAQDAAASFRAMGRRDAAQAARLFVAMTSDAALQELAAGRRVPAVRRALAGFVTPGA